MSLGSRILKMKDSGWKMGSEKLNYLAMKTAMSPEEQWRQR